MKKYSLSICRLHLVSCIGGIATIALVASPGVVLSAALPETKTAAAHVITKKEAESVARRAYEENMKQIVADHPDATAIYECERKKIVAVSANTKNFEPYLYINDPYSGEKMLANFMIIVVPQKHDGRCEAGYFDAYPFVKWMTCSAKYTIANDGYKLQPRSYSLAEMHSDDGLEFYGTDGLYFHGPGLGHTYLMQYGDEGDRFLEAGTCKKI